MAALSIHPGDTRAILIGASEFPRDQEHLLPLPAVKNNVEDLARIMADPEIMGIPPQNIATLLNEPKSSDVAEKLARKAKEATDTLIVYYAGHGLVGTTSKELYLATPDTTEEEAEYNAVPFSVVRKAIANSPARKKVLIIDSCFSGRALQQTMGSESGLLQANIDIKGTFAMSSAPCNQPAMAPLDAKYTSFSGELIKVLKDGIENRKETITLEELYETVRTEIRKNPDLPEPQHSNLQDADKIIFAHNRKAKLIAGEATLKRIEQLDGRLTEQEEALTAMRESIKKIEGILSNLSRRTMGIQGTHLPITTQEVSRAKHNLMSAGLLIVPLLFICFVNSPTLTHYVLGFDLVSVFGTPIAAGLSIILYSILAEKSAKVFRFVDPAPQPIIEALIPPWYSRRALFGISLIVIFYSVIFGVVGVLNFMRY